MTKKRSKCLFILFAILLVVSLIATFVNFTYPLSLKGNYYSYSNFVSNLKFGEDISTSLRLTYRADLPEYESEANYNSLLNETVIDLKDIIQGQGFKDVTVTTTENNQIIVTVGNILTEADKSEVVALIGDLSAISFSMESDSSKAFASAGDIEKIETQNMVSDKTYYYVRVNFKSSSMSKIKDATKEGGTLYIMMGDTTIGQMDIEASTLSSGHLDIYSEQFIDEQTANTYANQLRTGTFGLQLTQLDNATISPSYGNGAMLMLSIALVVFVLAAFAYLICKYKHLGWLASFSMLFYICISLFLLQSIPTIHINLGGLLALVVSFILAVDSVAIIFDKAKEHYNADVKLFISLKMAQKETLVKNCILNVLLMVVGFVCMFMPTLAVQSFGWVAFVMSFVSLFNALVLMRLFIKMYLPFNNNNGKKCNFHKGGKNA